MTEPQVSQRSREIVASVAYQDGCREETRDDILRRDAFYLNATRVKASVACMAVDQALAEASAPTPTPQPMEKLARELRDAAKAIREHVPDADCSFYPVAVSTADPQRRTVAGVLHAELLERAANALDLNREGVSDDEMLVSKAAAAIYLVGEDWDTKNSFDSLPEYGQDYWRDRARAALSIYRQHASSLNRVPIADETPLRKALERAGVRARTLARNIIDQVGLGVCDDEIEALNTISREIDAALSSTTTPIDGEDGS